MASDIKNVAVVGYGRVGKVVVKHLLSSPSNFNLTILSRATSSNPSLAHLASSNPSIRVQKVSYTGGPDSSERESLTSALAGIDAVVCTLAMSGIADEKNLIDAARAAGVKLFIPADYSSATSDPGARWLPVYALVVEMQRYLHARYVEDFSRYQRLQRQTEPMEWVIVAIGALIEFVFDSIYFVDFENRRTVLWDDGKGRASLSDFDIVGAAVVGILQKGIKHLPGWGTMGDAVQERTVKVHGATASQLEVLEWAQKHEPRKAAEQEPWDVKTDSSKRYIEHAMKQLQDKDAPPLQGTALKEVMTNLIAAATCGNGGGFEGAYKHPDNESLGVPFFEDGYLEEQVRLRVQQGTWAERSATADQESMADVADLIFEGHKKAGQ